MKDNYKLKIKFQGKDWKEYGFVVNEFTKTEVLHKDLKPADASCQFSLLPNIELNNLLLGMGEYDVQAQITKNDKPFFTGFIKKTFAIPKGQRLNPVAIELVSGGYLLKQKIGRDVFIKSKKNVTETVKEILDLAGVPHKPIPAINDILYGVHLKPNDTYHKILTDILFEYGYTFYFDAEGIFSFINLFLKNPIRQFEVTGRECLDLISLEHNEKKKTEISIEWTGIEIFEDTYAFQETEGKQMGYSCRVELLGAAFYKNAPDGIFIPYKNNNGEVILAEDVALDIDGEMSKIKVQAFEAYNTKAFLKVKNTDNIFNAYITKLNFKAAKVYVKKSKNKSKAANNTTNNKAQNIKTSYIFTKARAEILSQDLLNYYNLSNLVYKFKSASRYPLGAIITITDRNIGTGLCRILELKENITENYTEYTAESVGAYTPPKAVKSEAEAIPKPPQDGKDGADGKPGKEGKPGKDGKTPAYPPDNIKRLYINFDEKRKMLPGPDPSYTAWQSRIIEYDCTGKNEIKMTFKEALNNVIILSGELKNDFTLTLFFDKRNGNGAKQYLIVYRLTGKYKLTIKSTCEDKQKIEKHITAETYGMGCYAVVDFAGNVWHFRGEKGQGGLLKELDVAGAIEELDYFIIEKENETKKLKKTDGIFAIQKNDSPIGEIKMFFDGEYKHGFLEANGLPFSPDVFPEFKLYVKKNFNTGTDALTGWPLRPKLEGVMPGTKIFIKAVQGV